jgi:hypothetical protein
VAPPGTTTAATSTAEIINRIRLMMATPSRGLGRDTP